MNTYVLVVPRECLIWRHYRIKDLDQENILGYKQIILLKSLWETFNNRMTLYDIIILYCKFCWSKNLSKTWWHCWYHKNSSQMDGRQMMFSNGISFYTQRHLTSFLWCDEYCAISEHAVITQITKFMEPTWGPPGCCRPQMSPMFVPWTLLSG